VTAAWQDEWLAQLSALFEGDEGALALVLGGSMASADGSADDWSDVDLTIILSDAALERYYGSSTWLAGLGTVMAEDRVAHSSTKTLRVCLTPFRRLDLTFIPESALASASSWEFNPFPGACRILWSRIPDLEGLIRAIPPAKEFADAAEAQLSRMEESFWFKATLAIAKAARNDLLVALHLALDLQRDCLALQMLLRDRSLRRNVHRTGGPPWNKIVAELLTQKHTDAVQNALDIVERRCACFDALAAEVSPSHRARSPSLALAIERARDEGRVRQ
jgi:hypothetical protein